ncbi:Tetraacyldisaccharide 4'-kinase [plant metagenome]|uniref:tetraacyldisaccharide 4'-kinase n=1 Tax=plant metagenome TaxID=1297885 RepID=A0A484TKD1_9ZZZZ
MTMGRGATLLQRQWQTGGWLSTLLRPLSCLTGLAIRLRRRAHARGWRKTWRAPVPVVVVGNVYVGGTGKTPVTIAVVRALRERGWHPGVISRGYGVKIGPAPRSGRGTLSADDFGDEPALIAQETQVPVAVHPQRPLAGKALLARWPDVDVIVCDDGLQHLPLGRDVEIAVDDERGVGNGLLLPAGPLREPPARLDTVDAIVTNRSMHATSDSAAGAALGVPYRSDMRLTPSRYVNLVSGESLSPADFMARYGATPLAAAAGIGQPERFFSMLRHAGLNLVQTLPLPDHYAYHGSPFDSLQAEGVLITAKDAVKCAGLGDKRLWTVHADTAFSRPALFDWLDVRLRAAAAQRRQRHAQPPPAPGKVD